MLLSGSADGYLPAVGSRHDPQRVFDLRANCCAEDDSAIFGDDCANELALAVGRQKAPLLAKDARNGAPGPWQIAAA
jgi:hypothetical protein